MFKSYFGLCGHAAGAFFLKKKHISGILDMTNSQKMTLKLFLVCGCSRRVFFSEKIHISIDFNITISLKVCF